MAATAARPEGAEYITAVDQLAQLIRETYRHDHSRIQGMLNAVNEFQERFQVGVEVGLNINNSGVPELQTGILVPPASPPTYRQFYGGRGFGTRGIDY